MGMFNDSWLLHWREINDVLTNVLTGALGRGEKEP